MNFIRLELKVDRQGTKVGILIAVDNIIGKRQKHETEALNLEPKPNVTMKLVVQRRNILI